MRIASAGAFEPLAHPVDDTSPAAAGAEGHQARMPGAARPRIAGGPTNPSDPASRLGRPLTCLSPDMKLSTTAQSCVCLHASACADHGTSFRPISRIAG